MKIFTLAIWLFVFVTTEKIFREKNGIINLSNSGELLLQISTYIKL